MSMYTILIALANNVDNISVRIAYSIRKVRISTVKNLWISIITLVISSCAAQIGTALSEYCTNRVASLMSMLLLIAIGFWILVEPYIKKESSPDPMSNADEDRDIGFKEATLLGIALSINNLGGGLSAGMLRLNCFYVGFFSAVISFIALWAGNYITVFFNRWNLDRRMSVFAGILLILIGIKRGI